MLKIFPIYQFCIFNNKSLTINRKMKVLNAYVEPIFLYNSETWTLTKTQEEKINVFQRTLIRKFVLAAKWPKTVSNEALYAKINDPLKWSITYFISRSCQLNIGNPWKLPKNLPKTLKNPLKNSPTKSLKTLKMLKKIHKHVVFFLTEFVGRWSGGCSPMCVCWKHCSSGWDGVTFPGASTIE